MPLQTAVIVVTPRRMNLQVKSRTHFRAVHDLLRQAIYAGVMRYPDGGGLPASGWARREKVRLRAARIFEQGIARSLG